MFKKLIGLGLLAVVVGSKARSSDRLQTLQERLTATKAAQQTKTITLDDYRKTLKLILTAANNAKESTVAAECNSLLEAYYKGDYSALKLTDDELAAIVNPKLPIKEATSKN